MISEKQAKETADHIAKANANPKKYYVTGKLMAKNEESGEWEGTETAAPKSHASIIWGWMGRQFGPDENGLMVEILNPGGKKTPRTFGSALLPEAAYLHHMQGIKQADDHMTKYEVIPEEEKLEREKLSSGKIDISKMSDKQLKAEGKKKGLDDADMEGLSHEDLVKLISE